MDALQALQRHRAALQPMAKLAAALVAFQTHDAIGQRLLDQTMLHAVLVMLAVTSVVGLLLTQRYAPRLLAAGPGAVAAPHTSP
jgi:hypothetical protein